MSLMNEMWGLAESFNFNHLPHNMIELALSSRSLFHLLFTCAAMKFFTLTYRKWEEGCQLGPQKGSDWRNTLTHI